MKYHRTELPLFVLKKHKPVRVKNLYAWAEWFEKHRSIARDEDKKNFGEHDIPRDGGFF